MENYLYFAFGANTEIDSMSYRCPTSLDLGPAVLPNYKLRFARHADVVMEPNSQVIGVLWEVTPDDLETLDIFEGYPTYYERKTVAVQHNGEVKLALVYYMTPGHGEAVPSKEYFELILEGFEQHGLPRTQLDTAKSSAAIAQSTGRIYD